MPLHAWRRFRSAPSHASCASRFEEGVNYTSHHLRCTQLQESSSQRSRCQQRPSSREQAARSWPGTSPCSELDEDDTYSTIFTPLHELQYTESSKNKSAARRRASTTAISSRQSTASPVIREPPLCRLPASMRFSSLICYITITLFLLTASTTAAPSWRRSDAHAHLHRRQAIPDSSGNTGNEPAPVKPDVPPQPFTFSPSATATAESLSTITAESEPTITAASSPSAIIASSASVEATSSPSVEPTVVSSESASTTIAPPTPETPEATSIVPGSSGNTNSPDNIGQSPGNRPTPFPVASPVTIFSAGTIAGIAGGGVVLVSIFIFIIIWIYRRRRVDVNEIEVRRSKIGSRLAARVFGGKDNGSRSVSRADSVGSASTGPYPYDEKRYESGVDKATVGKPENGRLDNGFLALPKPLFMREREKESTDEAAPWVDKGTISAPRPGRPKSAEPLGRLSGMGMGMGYLK